MGEEFKISEETARKLLESRGYKVEKQLPKLERTLRTTNTNALVAVVGSDNCGDHQDIRAKLVISTGTNAFSARDIHELRAWLNYLTLDMEKHNGQ